MKRNPDAATFEVETYLVSKAVIDHGKFWVGSLPSQVFSNLYDLITSDRFARSFAAGHEPVLYPADLFGLAKCIESAVERSNLEVAGPVLLGWLTVTSHVIGFQAPRPEGERDRKLMKTFKVEVSKEDEDRPRIFCTVTEV